MSTKSPPPERREVETQLDDLIRYGQKKEIARWLGRDYDTLCDQLSPNNPTKSDFYRCVELLVAFCNTDERLGAEALDLLNSIVRPRLVKPADEDAKRAAGSALTLLTEFLTEERSEAEKVALAVRARDEVDRAIGGLRFDGPREVKRA